MKLILASTVVNCHFTVFDSPKIQTPIHISASLNSSKMSLGSINDLMLDAVFAPITGFILPYRIFLEVRFLPTKINFQVLAVSVAEPVKVTEATFELTLIKFPSLK